MIMHENPSYQALIDELEKLILENVFGTLFTSKLEELNCLVEKTNDPVLKVLLAYGKSIIPYEEADFHTAEKYVEEALNFAKEINLTYYIMRCYNSLAIIASQHANYYESTSYYLHAFHIAESHPEYKYSTILLNNIGNLFVWLDEYEAAISYLTKSYHKYYEEKLDNNLFISTIVLNIVEEYSLFGNYAKAKEWASLDIKHVRDTKDSIVMILALNELDTAYQIQDEETTQKSISTIFKHANEDDNFIYVFRVYLRLLRYATKAYDKKTAHLVIEKAERMANNRSIGTFHHEFIVAKYHYYKTFQQEHDDGKIIKDLMKEYVESSEDMIKQLQNTYNRRLIIETELLKVTSEKEAAIHRTKQLQKDIELDYFTQILNKVSMETYITKEIAKKEQYTHQALFLIDIDHFKKVNDTYGHNRGDELILAVVNMLSSACSKNILLGRFGGDEFMLFAKNARTIKYFETFAEELLARAQAILITKDERITLSIGIHIIEDSNTTFKDTFQKADDALYETKRKGRNGYTIYKSK